MLNLCNTSVVQIFFNICIELFFLLFCLALTWNNLTATSFLLEIVITPASGDLRIIQKGKNYSYSHQRRPRIFNYTQVMNLGKGLFWGILVRFVCKFCLILELTVFYSFLKTQKLSIYKTRNYLLSPVNKKSIKIIWPILGEITLKVKFNFQIKIFLF